MFPCSILPLSASKRPKYSKSLSWPTRDQSSPSDHQFHLEPTVQSPEVEVGVVYCSYTNSTHSLVYTYMHVDPCWLHNSEDIHTHSYKEKIGKAVAQKSYKTLAQEALKDPATRKCITEMCGRKWPKK